MNRSKVVLKNIIWELGYYLIVIVLGFLAPRLIILVYGSEVNGLSSTITQILNVVLLLQSGATTAAVFSLYGPIAEDNIKEIGANVRATTKYFQRIACIFLVLMFLTAIVTEKTLKSSINGSYIFIAFIIMGIKSFLDLYFTSKYRVVFTAYEKKFYVSIGTLIEQIIYYFLVFGAIFLRIHFILLYVWLLLGCVIKIIYLHHTYRKKYSFIPTDKTSEVKRIPGTLYALANEVSHSVVSSSITILLSFMYSLHEASVYSVYALVSSALTLIATAVYSAFAPSFGNIVALHDNKTTRSTFEIFQYIYIAFNTILMMCMLYLLVPFVKIYTHGATDTDYINNGLAYMLAICGVISALRVPYNIVVASYGYFKETWVQPVISAVISIFISIIMGKIDYSLIIVGPIVFYTINYIYQYYKLKKLLPFLIGNNSFVLAMISVMGLLFAYAVSVIFPFRDGLFYWIGNAFFSVIGASAFVIAASCILARASLYKAIIYIKSMIGRRVNNE